MEMGPSAVAASSAETAETTDVRSRPHRASHQSSSASSYFAFAVMCWASISKHPRRFLSWTLDVLHQAYSAARHCHSQRKAVLVELRGCYRNPDAKLSRYYPSLHASYGLSLMDRYTLESVLASHKPRMVLARHSAFCLTCKARRPLQTVAYPRA